MRTPEEQLVGAQREAEDLARIADLLRAENRAHEKTIADLREELTRVAVDARERESKACVEIMGKVIADNGCDCCDENGDDFDGPHEGMACKEWGHEPCLACLMNAACNAIAARRAG